MNTKLRKALSEACKDFGLTEKALDELCESGSKGLSETSTDEEIKKATDLLVPFARMMQGEITRKTSKSKFEDEKSALLKQIEELKAKIEDPQKGKEPPKTDEPEWFKQYREKQDEALKALKEENDKFKLEQARKQRTELINEKAKELGIPSFLMKRVTISDEDDYEKVLAEMKQELVDNSLGSQFGDPKQTEAVDKSAALSFVNSL